MSQPGLMRNGATHQRILAASSADLALEHDHDTIPANAARFSIGLHHPRQPTGGTSLPSMATTVPDWMDEQVQRIVAAQRAKADTAKLVATFAAGIAGTLVASALQAGASKQPTHLHWGGGISLGVVFLLALLVIVLDRIEEANYWAVLEAAAVARPRWSETRTVGELRTAARTARNQNEKVVRWMIRCLWLQVTVAVLTSGVAAYSMLRG